MHILRAKGLALTLATFVLAVIPTAAVAQSLQPDSETFAKARVISVAQAGTQQVPGTELTADVQTLTAEILEGPEQGKVVTFVNDFAQLEEGDVFYLRHLASPLEGTEFYSVADPYRLPIIFGLVAVFLALLVLFGGIQGLRGLVSLAGSFILIFYLLLPGIVAGYPPVLVAVGVSSLIIIAGSYITHGFNRTTTAAVLGMIATVAASSLAAWYVVGAAALSGFSGEESGYLHFQYGGTLDLVGILMSGIIIGLLGVLYDVAIGQAVAVEELMAAGQHLDKQTIYQRAIRIGREHIGALVNTLAIAYVGVALPLLLLLGNATAPLGYILNGEVIATELVRILIGASGIILAVPVTTLIAVFLVRKTSTVRHTH
ncbi:MAG TPA: YibE/F family protein [Candidatus Paceibacterota bacterium]|nr:YibE/F family protein [Candidatus Paceibacterota bacterium]